MADKTEYILSSNSPMELLKMLEIDKKECTFLSARERAALHHRLAEIREQVEGNKRPFVPYADKAETDAHEKQCGIDKPLFGF